MSLATRMEFGKTLIEIAKTNTEFVLFSADTKACGIEKFGQLYPKTTMQWHGNSTCLQKNLRGVASRDEGTGDPKRANSDAILNPSLPRVKIPSPNLSPQSRGEGQERSAN